MCILLYKLNVFVLFEHPLGFLKIWVLRKENLKPEVYGQASK